MKLKLFFQFVFVVSFSEEVAFEFGLGLFTDFTFFLISSEGHSPTDADLADNGLTRVDRSGFIGILLEHLPSIIESIHCSWLSELFLD